MVVLAYDDVLHHAVLVDTTEKAVVLALSIVAIVGVVNALDGVVITVERAVKPKGNLGNLRVAILADGWKLDGACSRATKVDVVHHLEILARALMVSGAALRHFGKIVSGLDLVRVGFGARARQSPRGWLCCGICLSHGYHGGDAKKDKSKNLLHKLIFNGYYWRMSDII